MPVRMPGISSLELRHVQSHMRSDQESAWPKTLIQPYLGAAEIPKKCPKLIACGDASAVFPFHPCPTDFIAYDPF